MMEIGLAHTLSPGQGGQTTRTTLQKKRRKRKKKSAVMTWTMKTTWRALPGQITHARTANYTFRTQEPGNLCATSTAGPKPSAAAAAAFQQFSSNRLITHSARADLAKSRDSLRTSAIGPGTSAPVPGACQDSPCQSILQHKHDKRPHTRTMALQQQSNQSSLQRNPLGLPRVNLKRWISMDADVGLLPTPFFFEIVFALAARDNVGQSVLFHMPIF